MTENYMAYGSSSFLVKDCELRAGWESQFISFLNNEGFRTWGRKGHYIGINWIYINLNNKRYAFGLPGISITVPIGDHAITKEEFMIIYDIYKKYDKEHPLKMLD